MPSWNLLKFRFKCESYSFAESFGRRRKRYIIKDSYDGLVEIGVSAAMRAENVIPAVDSGATQLRFAVKCISCKYACFALAKAALLCWLPVLAEAIFWVAVVTASIFGATTFLCVVVLVCVRRFVFGFSFIKSA